jgi:hypothetical protein
MFRIRRLRWRSLDVEFPIGRGLCCRIVERPGEWMPDRELAAVTAELRLVAAAAVRDGTLAYGALTGDRAQLDRSIITLVYDTGTRRPLAFSAMVLLPVTVKSAEREVLHLGLTLVHPDERGRNLSRSVYGSTMLLIYLRQWLRPLWVTNVSQVPSAIGSFATYFDAAYPGLGPDRRTPAHYAIVEQLMTRYRSAFGVGADAEFDIATFVIRNAYTGGSDNLKKSFAEATRHRRSSYGRLCFTALDYERGDDFLQVGRYSAFVALRCLGRRLRHWLSGLRHRPEPGHLGYPA